MDVSGITEWDHEVDVLVAGSGAGGMVAAIAAHDRGLSALVVEKAEAFGGSTAMSGGGIWVPNNRWLKRKGLGDDVEDVRAYMHALVGDRVAPERIDAYVERGPEVFDMLQRVSRWMDFSHCPGYSDYHPELPGGRAKGRTIEPRPIDGRKLGDEESKLLGLDVPTPMGLWFTGYEARNLMMMGREPRTRWMFFVAGWRVVSNLFLRRRMKTLGAALVARLRLTMRDLGLDLWTSSPVVDLVHDGGRVVGAVVEREGRTVRIRARRGVLLATGGFEHNEEMRKEHLPELGRPNHSAGVASNTGDGHVLGAAVGVDFDLMDDAWWMPSIALPRGGVFPLVSERCIPGMVIVNEAGRRFTNEASPYVNFVHDQIEGGHVPAFEVFDQQARNRYQFAGVLQGKDFPKSFYRSGLVTKADTLEDLAEAIGVDPAGLAATVQRFNEGARKGVDPDFHRGESPYDNYYGDHSLRNPNIDTIERGPFYAVRLEAGDLGTKGGIVTDEKARALRPDGSVVEGLYATGNVSAAVMGNEYAGAGATIGPAMVFSYLAMEHAAGES